MPAKLIITQPNLTLKGGAERVVLKIAEHYNAKIYTCEYSPDKTFDEFKDIDIKVIGKNSFYKIGYNRASQGLNYGLTFYNYKIKEDYDVLNPHVAPSHWIRNKNDRVLWYCHTPLRDIYDLYSYRQAMRPFLTRNVYRMIIPSIRFIDKREVHKIRYIATNSKNTNRRIKRYYNRDDAVVLNGGVDIDKYKNVDYENYFFYPSRISPNKRQEFAINAFKIFKRMYDKDNFKLIISGQVSDDPFYSDYYEKLKDMVKGRDDVEILTNVDDDQLIDLYSRSRAVLYPPLNEDYGLVPIEAMASGKPVIVVNEGGPKETVTDNSDGYIIKNEMDMADKMYVLAMDKDKAESMGKVGYENVKKYYTWDSFFKKYDELIYKTKNSK